MRCHTPRSNPTAPHLPYTTLVRSRTGIRGENALTPRLDSRLYGLGGGNAIGHGCDHAGMLALRQLANGINQVVAGLRCDRIGGAKPIIAAPQIRSEEPTYELQSLMRNTYAVYCLKQQIQSLQ